MVIIDVVKQKTYITGLHVAGRDQDCGHGAVEWRRCPCDQHLVRTQIFADLHVYVTSYEYGDALHCKLLVRLPRCVTGGSCSGAAPLDARLSPALFAAELDFVPALFPFLALDNNELTLLTVLETLPHPCRKQTAAWASGNSTFALPSM